jgi:hypothetical protein
VIFGESEYLIEKDVIYTTLVAANENVTVLEVFLITFLPTL